MKHALKRTIAITLILTLSGCATTQNIQSKDASSGDCIASALAGGLLGAMVSGRGDAFIGAVAGAATGMFACLLVKSNVRQTKTAAQVDQSIRAQNRGQLPAEPTAQNYTIALSPSGRMSRDGVAKIYSNVDIANGSRVAATAVREEITLTAPNGQQKVIARDEFKEKSGGFEKVTELKLNQNMLDGQYNIKTNLYINNKLAQSKSTVLELVQGYVVTPNLAFLKQ